ncbi:hypothetical protein KCU95_g941, partial [Aureobasidium melanogenum]
MGNIESQLLSRTLSKEIPSIEEAASVFSSEADRQHFIDSIILVATANGSIDVTFNEFKLLYSRVDGQGSKILARIVARENGTIKAKIEPEEGGTTEEEALLALRKFVETRAEQILKTVPNLAARTEGEGKDDPPSYSSFSSDVKVLPE